MTVAAIPLPVLFEPQERPSQTGFAGTFAIDANLDHFEASNFAFGNFITLEQGLDADAGSFRINRQRHRTLDGAAAGLTQSQQYIGFERPRGAGNRWQHDGDVSATIGTRIDQTFERLAHDRQLLFRAAKAVAGISVNILVGGFYNDVAFNREVGGRRAIKVTTGELHG